jgi:cellobiose PTS system EIIB component
MKKIVLLCAAGMSTGMLVKKMQTAAHEKNYEYDISAHPISEAKQAAADADIILLGPQVRFSLGKVKELCPEILVESIDMQIYGCMDGEKLLDNIKEKIGV